jgi:intergrase/recombinase
MGETVEKKEYPLVIVFYLDREMMKNVEITRKFAESVDELIKIKKFNALAFFLPTDTEERVECINPIIATKEQMDTVEKLISEISKNFGIGDTTQNENNVL